MPSAADTHVFTRLSEPVQLREIVRDDIFLLGGQFAILCQWAHPGLAIGTYRHSNFASRIMKRLQNTARFMNAAVFGTLEEQQAIGSVIHRYHSTVKGENYDANDPELHKWTAATLFVALIVVHEAVFGKIGQAKLESMFRESAVYGTCLRMPPEMWPETLEDFWEYWNNNISTLEVTAEARS